MNNTESIVTQQQTMSFRDRASVTSDSPPNPLESTFMLADTSDNVAGFFSRPQLIDSFEWTPGVAVGRRINPWSLYFDNDEVARRLSNFHLLRCRLKLKIMINSTPFYYGRMLMSYTPLGPLDAYTLFRPGNLADYVEATQRPHVIINPSDDQMAMMDLPYMYPRSALNLETREYSNMGVLDIADLTALRNANDAVDSITVSIMAWAEDVSYSQPTSLLIPNEGEYEDDLPQGIVSKPATTVARMAAALSSWPPIAPYAKATEMVARLVGGVAHALGFSRPRIIAPSNPFHFSMYRNMAATNISDQADVLALDEKKEVTIDPRVAGVGTVDDMAIVPIAKKECYLTTFPWRVADAQDTLLYNFRVNPLMYINETTGMHMSPMCWLATPFRYWRGSITYRFEVVASKFHRGRVRLLYDPVYQATTQYNVNYAQIVDIADGCDFSITVGWAQGVPYLRTPPLDFNNEYHGKDSYTRADPCCNGVLSMVVLNTLTTPSSTDDDVFVNVYVSANDDFEIQEPTSGPLSGLVGVSNGNNPVPPNPNNPNELSPIVGNYTVYNQSTDDTVPPQDIWPRKTGVLIGASRTSTEYSDTTFTIRRLDTTVEVQNISFELYTDAPDPTGLSIVSGTYAPTLVWEPPNSVNENLWKTTYTLTDATPQGARTFNFLAPPGTMDNAVLIMDNLRSQFVLASLDWRPTDQGSNLTGPVSFELDYGPHWQLGPLSSVTLQIPPGNLETLCTTAEQGNASLRFEPIEGGFADISLPATTVPKQAGALDLDQSGVVVVTNNGNADVGIYSLGINQPIVPNEGDVEDVTMGGTPEEQPRLCDVFFGEIPTSIRQLFKRYTTRNVVSPPGELNVGSVYRRSFPIIPKGSAIPQLAGPQMSLWDWYIPAFLGWKGSVRIRAIPNLKSVTSVYITRLPDGAPEPTEQYLSGEFASFAWSGTTQGMGDFPAHAELPWYSNLRFLPARLSAGNNYFEPEPAFDLVVFEVNPNANGVTRRIQMLQSTGEDFGLYKFLCTPVISKL